MVGLAIASGVASLGSAIYGALKSAEDNKKARELIQQQRDSNRAWYDRKMAEDFTQRSDAQAVFEKQRQLLNEQYNKAQAAGVVAGASDESVALQKAAANDAMAQTMADVAAGASAERDRIEQQYRAEDDALNQQQAQTYAQQAQATAQAASQAVNAGLGLLGASINPSASAITTEAQAAERLAALGIKNPDEIKTPNFLSK